MISTRAIVIKGVFASEYHESAIKRSNNENKKIRRPKEASGDGETIIR